MAHSELGGRGRLRRNLLVAEGVQPDHAQVEIRRASMGPQLDSCGRRPTWYGGAARANGFNGAAT